MAINTDPTNGETPITTAPTYGGTGGGDQAAQYYAYQDFQKQFGRAPTQSELAMLSPNYLGGDPNIANLSAGKGAIAAYYNSMANTPTNITANQNVDALKQYQAGQTGFDATTNQAFQSATGQAATADELSHFGSLLATGQIDAYGLSQLVGQTQQAQQYQTQQYQNQLSTNLQSTQGNYFQNYINPSILSQTAAAGRDPNSSGVQQAEVQAGKQQNYDLQNYLAQFGAQQYGQSAQNQQNVYGAYLQNQYGLQNAGISQQLGEQNYLQQNNTNLQNQQYQQQSYQNYLNNYGKQSALQKASGIAGVFGAFLNPATALGQMYQKGSSGGGGSGGFPSSMGGGNGYDYTAI